MRTAYIPLGFVAVLLLKAVFENIRPQNAKRKDAFDITKARSYYYETQRIG